MKILVPTDFSGLSRNAADYATKLAVKLNGEIILLNVLSVQGPPHASMLKGQKLEEILMDNAKQDCTQLLAELKSGNKNLVCSYKIIDGFNVRRTIENYAMHNDIDLIIMGTKGASGLTKVLMGSNTAAVISTSHIPVLAIPEHARFNGIKHILYATDMHSISKEVQVLIPFARIFNASIHFLHVLPPDSKKKIYKDKVVSQFKSRYGYSKISVHVILNNDIEEGIEEYLTITKMDILVMFTHRPSFFEKIFAKSATREMSFHTSVPLLSFKKPIPYLTKRKLLVHE